MRFRVSEVPLYSTLLEHALGRRDTGARVEADGLADRSVNMIHEHASRALHVETYSTLLEHALGRRHARARVEADGLGPYA